MSNNLLFNMILCLLGDFDNLFLNLHGYLKSSLSSPQLKLKMHIPYFQEINDNMY